MRFPLLIVCWLAAAGVAAAQQPPKPAATPTIAENAATVSGVTITNAGIFTGQSTSGPARAGQFSPTHTVGTEADWRFISDSTDVPGQVGTQFGIEFRIDGEPAGEAVTLYLVFNFPPQGIRNPNTGDMMHAAKIAFPNMKIGALYLLGYGFDNSWEIIPGVWTEQIWYQNRMLAERTFTVTAAE